MDYGAELKKLGDDISPEDKTELEKLSSLQKDIAISESAEDFIRHPFFKSFENHLNDLIADTKGEVASLLKKPGVTIGEVQGVQNGIDKLIEVKKWLNSKVIAGRVGRQAIELYEQETEDLNQRVEEAINKSVQQ